ncbi:MAG: hypothetical protein CL799_06455 [Chromatiales bacterium]|jgi:hypothetical protein|nr:hypothetical protein [Chromatiales bacterium]MDP7094076.1 hypothetical protein [Gammaproteobacteria bacterium]MDP7271322.1 hypothetical protein [Gammaproteobacteria bacterium]
MSASFRRAFVVLLFLTVSSAAQASLLSFKITGEVTVVDATLSSEFSVGESVEFGFTLDSADFLDFGGTSTVVDGTSFTTYDRYYIFGGDYFGTGGTDESGIFFDYYTAYSPEYQAFRHEDHSMTSADVGGLTKS